MHAACCCFSQGAANYGGAAGSGRAEGIDTSRKTPKRQKQAISGTAAGPLTSCIPAAAAGRCPPAQSTEVFEIEGSSAAAQQLQELVIGQGAGRGGSTGQPGLLQGLLCAPATSIVALLPHLAVFCAKTDTQVLPICFPCPRCAGQLWLTKLRPTPQPHQ